MAKIAISYRRSDSQDITGRIFDRLAAHYGKDTVFRDIDSIQPGIDFRRQIADALRTTDVLLVVAGPAWLGQGKGTATRMENEADPVRIEVETALKRDIPIIPVLVGGMRMPEIAELPLSLKDFAYRHAVTVDGGRDFDHHIEGLIRALDRIVHAPQKGDAAPPSPEIKVSPRSSALRTYGLIGSLGAVVLVLAAALWRTETKQTAVPLSLPSSQSAPVSASTPVSTTSAAPASAIAPMPQVACSRNPGRRHTGVRLQQEPRCRRACGLPQRSAFISRSAIECRIRSAAQPIEQGPGNCLMGSGAGMDEAARGLQQRRNLHSRRLSIQDNPTAIVALVLVLTWH